MPRIIEPPVPKHVIEITNHDPKQSMLVRRIGEDEKVVVKIGETKKFEVPYLGLIIGYSEKAGDHHVA